jgi:hypothetical protein
MNVMNIIFLKVIKGIRQWSQQSKPRRKNMERSSPSK